MTLLKRNNLGLLAKFTRAMLYLKRYLERQNSLIQKRYKQFSLVKQLSISMTLPVPRACSSSARNSPNSLNVFIKKKRLISTLGSGAFAIKMEPQKKKPHLLESLDNESIVEEGRAKINYSKNVFYNPVQEFNRDLSVAVINVFIEQILKRRATLIECLSASGLRSIRYAKEIPFLDTIIANDLDEKAVARIQDNVNMNGVEAKVRVNRGDAISVLHSFRANSTFFDIIDLDPYGSAAPFIDSAISAISDGGLFYYFRTTVCHMH